MLCLILIFVHYHLNKKIVSETKIENVSSLELLKEYYTRLTDIINLTIFKTLRIDSTNLNISPLQNR